MSFDFGGGLDEAPTDVPSETNVDPQSADYGSEQVTDSPAEPGDQVANQAENADFVDKTNPGSVTDAPAATNAGSTTQTFDDGSTLTTNADGTVTATNAPGTSTLDKLQAKAGSLLDQAQGAIKSQLDQITPASISKAAEGYAKQFVKQVATQVIATQLPPALQPYANKALNNAVNSANATSVNNLFNPQTPKAVTPPAPSNTSPASPATDEYPPGEYTTDSKGNTFKTLPDGTSSLVRAAEVPEDISPDTPGLVTKSPDTVSAGSVDNSAGNVGYVTGQDPENGTYYVRNEKTGQIVASGLTEQAATLKAQDQTFIDAGDVPANANPGSNAVNYTAPGSATDPQSDARSLVASDQTVKANTPGTVNDPGLALPPISSIVSGSIATAATAALNSAAAATQGLIRQAQNQQTARVQNQNKAQAGDWRVRLSLAPTSNYLYNAPDCGPVLWPLYNTNGVIFPYTPTIDVGYKANYTQYDLTHSNYRGYFYQNSYVDGVNVKGTFTAQDTAEANYLLAVIHFFRSVTKMFYGQDAQAGSPPPLVFLSGLGDFQFNQHPCVVSQFNYSLPADVNYIRAQNVPNNGTNQLAARNRQTTLGNPVSNAIQRLASLGQGIRPGALTAPFAPQGSLAANNPTYVPTKMDINITLLPIQSRQQVSQQFSLAGFANGNLLKGGFW
jgi:hypothetical protein